jgi:2-C-methyl-D-erythritol 4-phosphate cytidylyltransferase
VTRAGLVIVAAGRGERLGAEEEKALVPLLGRPMLAWALLAFDSFSQIVERVVLVPPGREGVFRERVVEPLGLGQSIEIVAGGTERQGSVRNGLQALTEECHWVLVHDAARPLVTAELVRRIFEVLERGESVVPALPLRDSVAQVGFESWLKTYANRNRLVGIQTPQAFIRSVLEYAHRKAEEDGMVGTDDASLVLRINHAVSWIEGEAENLKITYPGDLKLAEAILRQRGHSLEVPE